RSADQRDRRAHEPPPPEDRRRLRPAAAADRARRRLSPAHGAMSEDGHRRASPVRRRSSLIFRFTLAHAALTCVVIAGVLGFLYAWTLEAQRRRIDEALAAEADGLRSSLVGLSISEMAAVITRVSGDARGGRSIYVLSTRTREIVAGNLPSWPSGLEGAPGALEF